MEISAGLLDWTSNDEENFSKFLDTPTGQRLIPKLLEFTPALLAEGEINKILIRTGEVRAYGDVARTLLALAHPAPKVKDETPTEYAPLEDDSKWDDGQKLTPEQ